MCRGMKSSMCVKQQQESIGVMEGGEERKGREVGGETQWQEIVNHRRDHAKAKGRWRVLAEPLTMGVSHGIPGGFLKPLCTKSNKAPFGANHSRNSWLVSHHVAGSVSWE